jgi:hypothetical protein
VDEDGWSRANREIAWLLGVDILPPPASAPAVTSGAAPAVTSGAAHASADAISDVSSDTSDTSSDVAPEASTNVVDVSMSAVLGREIAMLAGNRDIPTAITDAIPNNPDIITTATTDAITNNPAIANTLLKFIANAIANPANTEIAEALRLQFVAVAEARDIGNELLGRGPPNVAPWNHTPQDSINI